MSSLSTNYFDPAQTVQEIVAQAGFDTTKAQDAFEVLIHKGTEGIAGIASILARKPELSPLVGGLIEPLLAGDQEARSTAFAASKVILPALARMWDRQASDAQEKILNLLIADASEEAVQAITSVHMMFEYKQTPETMHALGEIGSESAVAAIAATKAQRGYESTMRAAQLWFCDKIGSPAAMDVIARLAEQDDYPSAHTEVLGKFGAAAHLGGLTHSAKPTVAHSAYSNLTKIDSDEARQFLASTRSRFLGSLDIIEGKAKVIRLNADKAARVHGREALNNFYNDVNNVAGAAQNYAAGDPVKAMQIISTLADMGYQLCNSIRDIYNEYPEHQDAGRAILQKIDTKSSVFAMLRDLKTEEEAVAAGAVAVYMTCDLYEPFKPLIGAFPELPGKIHETFDRTHPRAFDAALTMSDRYGGEWDNTMYALLKQNPTPKNIKKAAEAGRTPERAAPFIAHMAEIGSAAAIQSIVGIAAYPYTQSAVQGISVLAASGHRDAPSGIAHIGKCTGYSVEALETLIELRRHKRGANAQAISDVMIPLIKTLARPSFLRQALPHFDAETRGKLGDVFAATDRARILPEAGRGYFTSLFREVTSILDRTEAQKTRHNEIFGKSAPKAP